MSLLDSRSRSDANALTLRLWHSSLIRRPWIILWVFYLVALDPRWSYVAETLRHLFWFLDLRFLFERLLGLLVGIYCLLRVDWCWTYNFPTREGRLRAGWVSLKCCWVLSSLHRCNVHMAACVVSISLFVNEICAHLRFNNFYCGYQVKRFRSPFWRCPLCFTARAQSIRLEPSPHIWYVFNYKIVLTTIVSLSPISRTFTSSTLVSARALPHLHVQAYSWIVVSWLRQCQTYRAHGVYTMPWVMRITCAY